MLLMPLAPGCVQERNHRQTFPLHRPLKAVTPDLLPVAASLRVEHKEIVSSIAGPLERQLLAIHVASVYQWRVAERTPSRDDWHILQTVLNDVMKRQHARLIGFGNSVLAHSHHAIVAIQKVRLRRWNEVRLAERNKRHGGTGFLLSGQGCCGHQNEPDDLPHRSPS